MVERRRLFRNSANAVVAIDKNTNGFFTSDASCSTSSTNEIETFSNNFFNVKYHEDLHINYSRRPQRKNIFFNVKYEDLATATTDSTVRLTLIMKFSMSIGKPKPTLPGQHQPKAASSSSQQEPKTAGQPKAKAFNLFADALAEEDEKRAALKKQGVKYGSVALAAGYNPLGPPSSGGPGSTAAAGPHPPPPAGPPPPKLDKNLQKLLDENPEAFQYDEHLDEKELEKRNRTRTDALIQTKRVGLHVMDENFHEKLEGKKSLYVKGMMEGKERRDLERAIMEQKVVNREIEAENKEGGNKNPEVFVTGAYTRELEKRKEFERKMMEKDAADAEIFQSSGGAKFGFELHKNLLGAGRGGGQGAKVEGGTAVAVGGGRAASPKNSPKISSRPASPRLGAAAGAAPPELALAPGLSGAVSSAPIGPALPPGHAKQSDDLFGVQQGPQLPPKRSGSAGADPEDEDEINLEPDAKKAKSSPHPSPKMAIKTQEESVAQRREEEREKKVRAAAAAEQAKLLLEERKEREALNAKERKDKAALAKERYLARKKAGGAGGGQQGGEGE